MNHPTERQLMEHVTRRLDPAEAEPLQVHLLGCAGCRIRAEKLAALQPVLGEWETSAGAQDFAPAILAAVDRDARAQKRPWDYARVAAAVVLALGLGHVAARSLRTAPADLPRVDVATASETVGLDSLAGNDSADLDFVLQLAQVEGGLQ